MMNKANIVKTHVKSNSASQKFYFVHLSFNICICLVSIVFKMSYTWKNHSNWSGEHQRLTFCGRSWFYQMFSVYRKKRVYCVLQQIRQYVEINSIELDKKIDKWLDLYQLHTKVATQNRQWRAIEQLPKSNRLENQKCTHKTFRNCQSYKHTHTRNRTKSIFIVRNSNEMVMLEKSQFFSVNDSQQ